MASHELNEEIEEFMRSPLVVWFSSCVKDVINHKLTFEELVDGVLIYNVFLQMGIHDQINDVEAPNDDHVQRLKNLEVIMRNMRTFYYEDSVVLKEPNLRLIARAAHSNLADIEILLILLLGCAVKCPNKKHFIENITLLDEPIQEVIAKHIEKVLHFPDIVLCRDMLLIETTDHGEGEGEELRLHAQIVNKAFDAIRRINKERIELIEREEAKPPPNIPHCVSELSEWKSKALRLKHIEDGYVVELRKYAEHLHIAEKENLRLKSEAKAAKDYRDAMDATMEQAMKAERLELEVARYKEKLDNLESMKSRVSELKEDNKLLNENKEELVNQLNAYKAKVEKITSVEVKMYKLQEQCDKLLLENESFKKKTAELATLNEELEQMVQKSTLSLQSSTAISRSDESLNTSTNKSIGEPLSRSTNSKILRLELENRRLAKSVEALRESSFHSSSFKIIDLEKDKESLQLTKEDLIVRVRDLEEKLASERKEKKQLQALLESPQKLGGEDIESRVVSLESEKRKVQRDLDKTQAMLNEKLKSLEASSKIISELQGKLQALEEQLEQEDQETQNTSGEQLNWSIVNSPPKRAVLYARLRSDLLSVSQERDGLKDQVRDAQIKIKRQNESIERLEQRLQAFGPPDAPLEEKFQVLKRNFNQLMFEYSQTKSLSEQLKRQHSEDQQEMRAKNARMAKHNILINKLRNKVELLKKLNEQTESDKFALMEYVTQITKQNHELVAQNMEDKEHYFEEERKNVEIVNNLFRSKEKLEGKIIDQYKDLESVPVKKRNATVNAVRKTFGKVRKVGSQLLGKARRSRSGENSRAEQKSNELEHATPSDVQAKGSKKKKSVRFMINRESGKRSLKEKNNK